MKLMSAAYRRLFPHYYKSFDFEELRVNFNDDLLLKKLSKITSSGKLRATQPKISKILGLTPVIHIESLIDRVDIGHVKSLSSCVKVKYGRSQCVEREWIESPISYFGDEVIYNINEDLESSSATVYGGGNSVVFIGGFIQCLMPEFVGHILRNLSQATMQAGWYPHLSHLGIRCVESLIYREGGKLMLHLDSESIFTIVIMLSDLSSNDFTGGEFVIQDKQNDQNIQMLYLSMKVGDAIIFDSNAMHGVTPVLSGERNVLVLELWPYIDTEKGEHRPAASSYASRLTIPTLLKDHVTTFLPAPDAASLAQ